MRVGSKERNEDGVGDDGDGGGDGNWDVESEGDADGRGCGDHAAGSHISLWSGLWQYCQRYPLWPSKPGLADECCFVSIRKPSYGGGDGDEDYQA